MLDADMFKPVAHEVASRALLILLPDVALLLPRTLPPDHVR